MGNNSVVAKDSITLIPINDGISVSMFPSTYTVNADFNGENPNLDSAFTDLYLLAGGKKIPYTLTVSQISDARITYTVTDISNGIGKRFKLTSIPPDIIEGSIQFNLKPSFGDQVSDTFQFAVVKSVDSMEWLKIWDTNKTKIGSSYLITPQIFVGKKIVDGDTSVLTGVYMGPDQSGGAGLYGYKVGKEIFHINEDGGRIGGWDIAQNGIQTTDGTFQILSEGAIVVTDKLKNTIWGIYKTGEAAFSKGNVLFHADGSAYFNGEIVARSGKLAEWSIKESLLYSNYLMLDSNKHYIGVSPFDISTAGDVALLDHKTTAQNKGGVYLHYTSANSFGIEGYLPESKRVFQLGSGNMIAGWKFDENSIYIGTKNNTKAQYTQKDSITIGLNGLRSAGWRLESDGSGGLANGNIVWDANGNVTFKDDMSILWDIPGISEKLTKLDKNGIYTGQVSANNITSGTISTASITNKDNTWLLGQDGSGFLANKNIQWNKNGDVDIRGNLTVQSTGKAVEQMFSELECGKGNLLRNTGFTGDYLSAQFLSDMSLNESSETYSPSLLHWTATNATAQESLISESTKEAALTNGTLSQTLFYSILAATNYILSFKAKGNSLKFSCGGYEETVTLTTNWEYYVCKFQTISELNTFKIHTATCTICELQLERGTVASAWGQAMMDNVSDLYYYERLQYIFSAIKDGSVDILGGLILATQLQLGNYVDGALKKVTSGVSGIYNDDNDVAFWAGGNYGAAIKTVNGYKNNPTWEPTASELNEMANFVTTHGGKTILNDVILRGYIYALGGIFKGKVDIANEKILLKEDGSGHLANKNIEWKSNGEVTFKGNIFTPYLRLTEENRREYLGDAVYVQIDLEKTGLNIQFDFHSVNGHVIRLPNDPKWLGAEANFVFTRSINLSITYWKYDAEQSAIRVINALGSKGPFAEIKFKCIEIDPDKYNWLYNEAPQSIIWIEI